mgnify:CR=1 FL=1
MDHMHKSILSDVVQTQLSLTGGNKATAGYPSARPLLELGILIPPVMVTIKIVFLVPDPKAASGPRVAVRVHVSLYTAVSPTYKLLSGDWYITHKSSRLR